MNKLIEFFNEKYGDKYGKIPYPRTTMQIYRVYQSIKSYGIKDEELVKLLHNIKLPKPKSIEEKELYTDCLYNKDDSEMVIDTSNLISKENPVFTGSMSMNRKEGATIGEYSVAIGKTVEASGECSYAEGCRTTASGVVSHVEGDESVASGEVSHAEGSSTTASGTYSHAEGNSTTASGECQHVQGKFNIEDAANKYAHIVGNGTDEDTRSNAHTLDWEGNGWYAGKLFQEGTPTEDKDLTTKKYVDDRAIKYVASPIGFETSDMIKFYDSLPKNGIVVFSNNFYLSSVSLTINTTDLCYISSTDDVKNIAILTKDKYLSLKSDGTIISAGYIDNLLNYTISVLSDKNAKTGQTLKIGEEGLVWSDTPQLSFNDSGELIVIINGVSKTFTPKSE